MQRQQTDGQTDLKFPAGSVARVFIFSDASLELRQLRVGDGVPLLVQAAQLGLKVVALAVEADQVLLVDGQVDPAARAVAAGREGEGQQLRVFVSRPLVEFLPTAAAAGPKKEKVTLIRQRPSINARVQYVVVYL